MFKPESDYLMNFTSADESLLDGSFLHSMLDLGVFWNIFGSLREASLLAETVEAGLEGSFGSGRLLPDFVDASGLWWMFLLRCRKDGICSMIGSIK